MWGPAGGRAIMAPVTLVCLEIGKKRVFASALQWPGWSRSGRSEHDALESLASYLGRYREVLQGARLPAPDVDDFVVTERLPGDMTTDFGAPGAISSAEREPLAAGDRVRLGRIVAACWSYFDQVAAASGPQLRKGPRGGGRDRDPMVDHVLAAEAAYARKVGVRHPKPSYDDPAAVAVLRADVLAALTAPPPDPEPSWPLPYLARRVAWHVMDHAWEMQDRSLPG